MTGGYSSRASASSSVILAIVFPFLYDDDVNNLNIIDFERQNQHKNKFMGAVVIWLENFIKKIEFLERKVLYYKMWTQTA